MGKFGSGILDGKSVSKTPKLKGIDLPGSNDTSEDEKLLPALSPSSEPKSQFQFFFFLAYLFYTFQYISYKC